MGKSALTLASKRVLKSGALLIILTLLILSCGKKGNRSTTLSPPGLPGQNSQLSTPSSQTLDEALTELRELQPPQGVSPDLFALLKSELEKALIAKGVQKFTSKPPTGDENRVDNLELIDNGDGTYTLTWSYKNIGDYNQDGLVSAADISPIAFHFGHLVGTDSLDRVIDGNGDGIVSAADVSPIAFNFSTDVARYSVQSDPSWSNAWLEFQSVDFTANGGSERITFLTSIPDIGREAFRVVPVDIYGFPGEPSNVVGLDQPAEPPEGLGGGAALPWGTKTGEFNGVEAYSNGGGSLQRVGWPSDFLLPNGDLNPKYYGTFGYQYQCVEYTRRYTYYKWGKDFGKGNAYEWWDKAKKSNEYDTFDNGSSVIPQPGDVIVWGQGNTNGTKYGHTAVVRQVITGFNPGIFVIEQNISSNEDDGNRLIPASGTNNFYLNNRYGMPTKGWIRPKSGQPPPTKFSVSGKVLLENGAGYYGAWLTLLPTNGRTFTSAFGDYQFSNLPNGSYTIVPDPIPNYVISPATRQVTVNNGNVIGLNFTATQIVQVPIAVANANPTSGNAPLTVNFSATGSYDPDGSIVLYEWDFTTDGTYDWSNASDGDTTYVYNNPGNYTATLRVTDNGGAQATDTVGIMVNALPVAVANANPTSGNAPLTVNFSATGSYDPDGSIVLYEWDFDGNGFYDYANANTGNTQWTYYGPGLFRATLRVTDKDGATGTDLVWITVNPMNRPPIPIANANPTSGDAPLTVNFTAAGSNDPDGTIVFYEWDFTDDGTYDVSNATGIAQYTYTTARTYTARLRVTDNDGLTDTDSVTITVNEPSGGEWQIETVDSEGDVGRSLSLALDSSGNPMISYLKSYNFWNGDLKLARWNGEGWNLEFVVYGGVINVETSLAINLSGDPAISYVQGTDLKFAQWNGSSWNIATVDFRGIFAFWTPSLAFDVSGNPAIGYHDGIERDLKFARWSGSSWITETVDSAGDVGYLASLAFDSSGNPAISYRDFTNNDLKFAWWNGSSWNIETVDSIGDVGEGSSLAFDPVGSPAISYYDRTNTDLKFAWWNGSSWNIETVDSAGDVGGYTSLAFDSSGNPAIAYWDETNRDLKLAWWNGSTWQIQTVDSAGNVGSIPSFVFDPLGNPAISYWDGYGGTGGEPNQDLKFAIYY